MQLPLALVPLRHTVFRTLWIANVVSALGTWMQNTGAGWMMTTLDPDAFTVSMVQAATVIPVFILALPAGALADIVNRRSLIIITQTWMLAAAAILAALAYANWAGAGSLLVLTFALGIGTAMNGPAWGSLMADVVPRRDLPQAVALNGIGFNLARSVGPAIAGAIVLAGGPALAFALNAVSFAAVIVPLLLWHPRKREATYPPERLVSAMRIGMRFSRYSPVMRAAMLRASAFYGPAAAPWAMLPLVVQEQLHLGAGTYGVLLALMGIGGVSTGLLLPRARFYLSRNATVLLSSLCSFSAMAVLALSVNWLPSAAAMLVFGTGWVAVGALTQSAAQLSAPLWVRSRALAVYQLSYNAAMLAATFFWGWLGTEIGISMTMLAAAISGAVLSLATRNFDLESDSTAATAQTGLPLAPEAVAPELASWLTAARGRVLEYQSYAIDRDRQEEFLSVMAELRDVRRRAGAVSWQLYEDVAHPEGWLEVWSVENWTDHLREAVRMSAADSATLTRALAFHKGDPVAPRRYLAVEPHRLQGAPEPVASRNGAASAHL